MPDFRAVAKVGDIAEGSVHVVDVGDESVLVTRVDNEYFAVDNVCSHDDGPLGDGCMEGFELCCPRHEGRFDVRTGKAVKWPAVWPINAYPVRVSGDDIEVSVKP